MMKDNYYCIDKNCGWEGNKPSKQWHGKTEYDLVCPLCEKRVQDYEIDLYLDGSPQDIVEYFEQQGYDHEYDWDLLEKAAWDYGIIIDNDFLKDYYLLEVDTMTEEEMVKMYLEDTFDEHLQSLNVIFDGETPYKEVRRWLKYHIEEMVWDYIPANYEEMFVEGVDENLEVNLCEGHFCQFEDEERNEIWIYSFFDPDAEVFRFNYIYNLDPDEEYENFDGEVERGHTPLMYTDMQMENGHFFHEYLEADLLIEVLDAAL